MILRTSRSARRSQATDCCRREVSGRGSCRFSVAPKGSGLSRTICLRNAGPDRSGCKSRCLRSLIWGLSESIHGCATPQHSQPTGEHASEPDSFRCHRKSIGMWGAWSDATAPGRGARGPRSPTQPSRHSPDSPLLPHHFDTGHAREPAAHHRHGFRVRVDKEKPSPQFERRGAGRATPGEEVRDNAPRRA